jgi:hypothetical protein
MSHDDNPASETTPYNSPGKKDAPKAGPGFYPPTVVASMMTTLLLGAREDGTVYKDFEEQLTETRDTALASRDPEIQSLCKLLEFVHKFYKDGNEDLFLNAHVGIMLLLKKLAATKRWSDCLTVNRTNVIEVANLPAHRVR